jgi:hypothetical protein
MDRPPKCGTWTSLHGRLATTSNVSIDGSLTVTGDTFINGQLTVDNIRTSKNVYGEVIYGTSFIASLEIITSGAISSQSLVTATIDVGDTLNVGSTLISHGSLQVDGNANIDGLLRYKQRMVRCSSPTNTTYSDITITGSSSGDGDAADTAVITYSNCPINNVGMWQASSPSHFTIVDTGVYDIQATLTLSSLIATPPQEFHSFGSIISIWHNDEMASSITYPPSNYYLQTITIRDILELNEGDIIRIRITIINGDGTSGASGPSITFCGHHNMATSYYRLPGSNLN